LTTPRHLEVAEAVATGRHAAPRTEYAELKRSVEAHGLLVPQPTYYVAKLAVNAALLGVALFGLRLAADNPWWWCAELVFLTFVFVQIALLGHDVLHLQFVRAGRWNILLGLIVGNLLVGVSRAWWNDNHNAHHARPNDLGADPNVDIVFLACTAEQALSRPRWVQWVIRHQVALMVPIFSLEFFSMHHQSIAYALQRRPGCARLEGWLLGAHFFLYAAVLVVAFGPIGALAFGLAHQALTGIYMASIFAPNHKGMPLATRTAPSGFLREQVLTARNIRGNPIVDLLYGGLNYQIEHHLFPSMPRNNLRRARLVVRAYCAERGVSYCETGVVTAWRQILSHFGNVSRTLQTRAAWNEA
jgi:fatty acid desaturase